VKSHVTGMYMRTLKPKALERFLSVGTKGFSRPQPTSLAQNNVWGFLSKENSLQLTKLEKEVLLSIGKDLRYPVEEQLTARGSNLKDFEEGCELAYRRVAEIYEQGNCVFEKDHLDIVEQNIARQLDLQISEFRSEFKEPRLSLESVKAKALDAIILPKFQAANTPLLSVINLLQQKSKPYSDLGLLSHFYSRMALDTLGLFHDIYEELLVPVEFTVRESFKLISSDEVPNHPPRSYVEEWLQQNEKTPDKTMPTTSSDASMQKGEERTHYCIFVAEIPFAVMQNELVNDPLEFRLRSMGYRLQLPAEMESYVKQTSRK